MASTVAAQGTVLGVAVSAPARGLTLVLVGCTRPSTGKHVHETYLGLNNGALLEDLDDDVLVLVGAKLGL